MNNNARPKFRSGDPVIINLPEDTVHHEKRTKVKGVLSYAGDFYYELEDFPRYLK